MCLLARCHNAARIASCADDLAPSWEDAVLTVVTGKPATDQAKLMYILRKAIQLSITTPRKKSITTLTRFK